jgi:hypothetical protein
MFSVDDIYFHGSAAFHGLYLMVFLGTDRVLDDTWSKVSCDWTTVPYKQGRGPFFCGRTIHSTYLVEHPIYPQAVLTEDLCPESLSENVHLHFLFPSDPIPTTAKRN